MLFLHWVHDAAPVHMLQSVTSQAVQYLIPPGLVAHDPSGHDITHDCLSADRYQLPFVHESHLRAERAGHLSECSLMHRCPSVLQYAWWPLHVPNPESGGLSQNRFGPDDGTQRWPSSSQHLYPGAQRSLHVKSMLPGWKSSVHVGPQLPLPPVTASPVGGSAPAAFAHHWSVPPSVSFDEMLIVSVSQSSPTHPPSTTMVGGVMSGVEKVFH